MKRVTVVGSGNAFNTDGRAHAGYLLENSHAEWMLLDCGATTLLRLQQMHIDLDRIDSVLLTHFHGDHFAGLPFLLIEWDLVRRRTRPLIIAGPRGVESACRALMDICYPDFHDRLNFPVRYAEIERPGPIFEFQIEPFPISHRPESTGYRITGPEGNSFAFSGDTACDDRLFRLMEGVDVGLMELSMFEQSNPPTAHVSLAELRQSRPRIRAKRLYLSHIYDELARAARSLGLGETVHDGMQIEF